MIGFPGSAGSRPKLTCGPFSIIIITIIVVIIISTVISALFFDFFCSFLFVSAVWMLTHLFGCVADHGEPLQSVPV